MLMVLYKTSYLRVTFLAAALQTLVALNQGAFVLAGRGKTSANLLLKVDIQENTFIPAEQNWEVGCKVKRIRLGTTAFSCK